MTHYVFDASALVKAYLPEAGTARVLALLRDAAVGRVRITLSVLTYPETISAVARRERNARITAADATTIIGAINAAFMHPPLAFSVVETTPALAARAASLVRPHALSGADAVHLATALALRAALPPEDTVEFVSADTRLVAAAQAEGLAVIVPT